MSVLQGLLSGVAGGAVVAFFGWLLRESIRAALQRDLTSQAERLKYDLQRELLKAQLSTNQLHVLYPKLANKLRRAEGAVAGLYGFRFAPSYEGYDESDFESVLKALKLPGAERAGIMEALARDRKRGIKELEKITRRVEIEKARRLVLGAKNFAILKSLYLSDPVKEGAFAVVKTLWEYWVDIEVAAHPGFVAAKDHFQKMEARAQLISQQLQALEALMHQELHPRGDSTPRA